MVSGHLPMPYEDPHQRQRSRPLFSKVAIGDKAGYTGKLDSSKDSNLKSLWSHPWKMDSFFRYKILKTTRSNIFPQALGIGVPYFKYRGEGSQILWFHAIWGLCWYNLFWKLIGVF